MANNKVLFISQEIHPYLPDTPLALMGRNTPQRILEKGFEVRTFMPKYGCINERRNQLHEVIRLSGMNVSIDDTDHPLIIKVATLQPARMQVYFIDNDDYFVHSPIKDLELRLSPEDNDERMMFFVKGIAETVKKLRWEPAIIHAMGWVSALAPLYIKRMYTDDPTLAKSKVIYALHEESLPQPLDPRFVEKLKMLHFTPEDLASLGTEPVDNIALNRLAIDFADAVIVSSENVPAELIDYAKASGKPMLDASHEDSESFVNKYAEFYATLLD